MCIQALGIFCFIQWKALGGGDQFLLVTNAWKNKISTFWAFPFKSIGQKTSNSASKLAQLTFGTSGVKLKVTECSYSMWTVTIGWEMHGILDVEYFGSLSHKMLRSEWGLKAHLHIGAQHKLWAHLVLLAKQAEIQWWRIIDDMPKHTAMS